VIRKSGGKTNKRCNYIIYDFLFIKFHMEDNPTILFRPDMLHDGSGSNKNIIVSNLSYKSNNNLQSESSSSSPRKSLIKSSISSDECRRHREEITVQIRKNKRNTIKATQRRKIVR
jgi:hypothetical protein